MRTNDIFSKKMGSFPPKKLPYDKRFIGRILLNAFTRKEKLFSKSKIYLNYYSFQFVTKSYFSTVKLKKKNKKVRLKSG